MATSLLKRLLDAPRVKSLTPESLVAVKPLPMPNRLMDANEFRAWLNARYEYDQKNVSKSETNISEADLDL